MQAVERAAQARRELDRKFATLNLDSVVARPRAGWIRAIRRALGMSQAVLAERLAVSPAAVAKLEAAELHGGITIAKLAEVAAALDCRLVYTLVPERSLQDTVRDQARRRAQQLLGYAARTMALEAQEVDPDRQDEAVDRYADQIVRRGEVWRARRRGPRASP